MLVRFIGWVKTVSLLSQVGESWLALILPTQKCYCPTPSALEVLGRGDGTNGIINSSSPVVAKCLGPAVD